MLTNTVAPDSLGGLERYVRELSSNLVKSGCRATVVAKRANAGDPSQEVAADGVHVIRYSAPSKKDPTFAARYPLVIAKAVNAALQGLGADSVGGPTVIHGHFPVPALVPALRKLPFVYTLHAPVWRELLSERQDSYVLPAPLQRAAVASLKAAERLVVKRADRIITLSEFMRDEVLHLDPSAGQKLEVLAGGVDTEFFAPGPVKNDTWASAGAPLLFTARRHVPRTGVQELVAAMPAVLQRFPNARLGIAGSGPQTSHIEAEIGASGLSESVKLLGRISAEDLRDWYRRADLVVTPTQELEGFGLATAEALACGSPCLVTPVGANPEVVDLLSRSLVAEGCDPSGIGDGIVRLLTDADALDNVRRGARDAVAPALSWSTITDRHLDVYSRSLHATAARWGDAA